MKKAFVFLCMILITVSCFCACELDNSNSSGEKIKMSKSSEDYCGSEYTIDELIKHFNEMGFTNIKKIPCDAESDNYMNNIFEITIKKGLISEDPWKAGEEFNADAKIRIYYNKDPLLTVENCKDLATVLTSKNIDYMTFANKYDGKYVSFNAHVVAHSTYWGDSGHVICVLGGDYNGKYELGSFDNDDYPSLLIHIGNDSYGNKVDISVKEGQKVVISGRIEADESKYYKELYVECMEMKKR